MKKRIWALVIVFSVAALVPVLANAADYLPKDKVDGGNVVVSGEEDYENLFVGGGNVSIDKKIFGDLFVAGGSVNVSSPVEEDLFLAGGNVTVSAEVGGDARLGGGNVSVSAPVKGDLMIGGGTVNISRSAPVGGDFWAGAGAINVNGDIEGNVKIAGGEVFLNGEIGGNVEVWADSRLVFGPQSRVLGNIEYWGVKEAVIQDGAEVGQIEFHQAERKFPGKFNLRPIISIFLVLKMLALFLAALVVMKLCKKSSHDVASRAHKKPWTSLGIGFLGVVAIPVAVVILLATVVGSIIGFLLLVSFITALLFSSVFVVFFVGSLLERWFFKKQVGITWKTAVWGVVAGAVINIIPIVGWIVMCILYLMVFGSLLQEIKNKSGI